MLYINNVRINNIIQNRSFGCKKVLFAKFGNVLTALYRETFSNSDHFKFYKALEKSSVLSIQLKIRRDIRRAPLILK